MRQLRVLAAAERLCFAYQVMRKGAINRAFVKSMPDEPFPPHHVLYDAMSSISYPDYFESGKRVANVLYSMARHYLPENEVGICEWGCGPARIMRHLRTIDPSRRMHLFGTDYNPVSINWCQQAIAGVEFRLNGLAPPLPFDECAFDWLYCVSVFTHLSEEMHHQWLRELFRVVRMGGIVLLTTHGDNFTGKLLPAERRRYEEEGLVVRGQVAEGSRMYTAFQSPSFMHRLLSDQQILVHEPHPDPVIAGGQDVWIVKKVKAVN
jgi:SAM-dependent methyltransferase